jgi:hypothetical protein
MDSSIALGGNILFRYDRIAEKSIHVLDPSIWWRTINRLQFNGIKASWVVFEVWKCKYFLIFGCFILCPEEKIFWQIRTSMEQGGAWAFLWSLSGVCARLEEGMPFFDFVILCAVEFAKFAIIFCTIFNHLLICGANWCLTWLSCEN